MSVTKETLSSQVKERLPISRVIGRTVKLRKSGAGLVGLCPFHEEKSPSFHVRDGVGRFKCFGCDAGGDVFEFLMRLRSITFGEAVRELALECGLTSGSVVAPKEHTIHQVNRIAQKYFKESLFSKAGEVALKYLLTDRGLSEKMIKQAALGFAPEDMQGLIASFKKAGVSRHQAIAAGILAVRPTGELVSIFKNRVIFPILDQGGQVIAFGGRQIVDGQSPKYINTKTNEVYEKSESFYGLFESKNALLAGKSLVLVEGYFDALAFWAIGLPAMAICGTAINKKHVQMIKRFTKKIDVAFDNDFAGLKALKQSLSEFLDEDIFLGHIHLELHDPGEYLAKGKLGALKEAVAKKNDAFVAAIDLGARRAVGDVRQRITELYGILPIFQSISRPLVRRQYAAYLSKAFCEDPTVLWTEIEKKRKTPKLLKKLPPVVSISRHEELLLSLVLNYPNLLANLPAELHKQLSEPTKALCSLISGDGFSLPDLTDMANALGAGWPQKLTALYKQGQIHESTNAEALFDALVAKLGNPRSKRPKSQIKSVVIAKKTEISSVNIDKNPALEKTLNVAALPYEEDWL